MAPSWPLSAIGHSEGCQNAPDDVGADMFPTDRPLTVFTNELPIAVSLVMRPNLTVFALGGRLPGRAVAGVDSWAARILTEINVDVAFLGANGISIAQGLTTPDPAEAGIKRLMLSAGRRRIVLARTSSCAALQRLS
jgi:DeoR family fructose operon transcriptional repressor